MSVNSSIAAQMKVEILALETDIYKWEGNICTAKEDLADLRKAYKALIGEECSNDKPMQT